MFDNGHHILSGEINSGKSTKLHDIFLSKKKEGVLVSGWISLPYFENGKKVGYDIVFVRDSVEDERKRFIREREFEGSFQWKRFWFDSSVFEEAEKLARSSSAELFIIDEVGPLELNDHQGFWKLLPFVYDNFAASITVVRQSCADDFLKQFKRTRPASG